MKKLVSLLMCVLMVTSMANFSSIVNAVTSIELPQATNDEVISEEATEDVADDGLVNKKILGYFNGCTVEVSGMLPRVATLSLTSVNINSAQKLVDETDVEGDTFFACDIKIIDVNGEEWQPNETVKVKVTGVDETEKEIQFLHISEDIDSVLSEENPVDSIQTITDIEKGRNGELTFETSSFSTFVGFTVDFHYNGNTFSIGGMENVLLSKIFSQLGIDKDVADVENVTFTDESLVSVKKEDNDWRLTSHEAFQTNENLKVTFKDGNVLDITVTDAAYSITLGAGQTTTTVAGIKFDATDVDNDPTTVDAYTIATAYVTKGNTLTINIAGNIKLLGSNKQGVFPVPGGAEIVVNNTYGKDAYVFAGSSYPLFRGVKGSKISINGSEKARIILDGRKPSNGASLSSALSGGAATRTKPLVSWESYSSLDTSATSTLTLNYVTLQNSKTSTADIGAGGGIYLNTNLNNFNVNNCKFYNLTSSASDDSPGMGIAYASGTCTNFKLIGNYFEKCTTSTSGYGGGAVGIAATMSSTFEMTGNRFVGCTSKTYGGACFFRGTYNCSTMKFNNNAFKNCSVSAAKGRGGAIIFAGSSNISTTDIKFTYNDDFETYTKNDISMETAEKIEYKAAFENCTTPETFSISGEDVTVDNVSADMPSGGAIHIDTTTEADGNSFNLFVKPGVFDKLDVFRDCRSFISGAIGIDPQVSSGSYSNKNTVDKIVLDYGETDGAENDGADYNGNAKDGQLPKGKDGEVRTGATFRNCYAKGFGGVMFMPYYLNGSINVDGIIIDGAIATEGSAFCLWSKTAVKSFNITDSVIKNCDAPTMLGTYSTFGGTIRTKSGTTCVLNVKNTTFEKNDSSWNAGAIYWGAASATSGITSKLFIKNSMFDGNRASYTGGAIFCESFMNVSNTSFKNNSAVAAGGAIRTTLHRSPDGGKGNIEELDLSFGAGCEFINNEAGLFGGAICLDYRYSDGVDASYSSSNKYNYDFTMQSKFTSNDDLDGYFSDYDSGDTIPKEYYPKMIGNVAGIHGGALYYGMNFYKYATSGEEVTSPFDYTYSQLTKLLSSTEISTYNDFVNNQIEKNININAGIIKDNIAGFDGGGIYARGTNAKITVQNATFTGNMAGVKEYKMTLLGDTKKSGSTTLKHGPNPADFLETHRWKFISQTNDDGTYFHDRPMIVDPSEVGCGGAIALKGSGATCTINGGVFGQVNPDATDTSLVEEKYKYANKADFGGAIAVKDGTITIKNNSNINSSISTNYGAGGGAIFTMGSGKVVVDDGADVEYNYADGNESFIDTAISDETQKLIDNEQAELVKVISTWEKYTINKSTSGFDNDRRVLNVLSERADSDTVWKKGSGGGVYALTGTVQIDGGSVYGNTAINGAGGGVFAHLGGEVSMSGGSLYENSAKYISTPSATTTFESATLNGVGGAIALGDGSTNSDTGRSTFSITGSNIAIYNNLADFAADDVYASGKNTSLTVPNSTSMIIPGYEVAMTYAWYEDFHKEDTEFNNSRSISDATAASQVQRYRTGINKILIADVETASSNATYAVTDDNAYVCMTLGITKAGALKITKNITDKFNNDISDAYRENNNERYQFVITGQSGTVFPDKFYVYYNNELIESGHSLYPTLSKVSNTWTFNMYAGTTVALDVLGRVTVQEILTPDQESKFETNHAVTQNGVTTTYAGVTTQSLETSTSGARNADGTEIVFNNIVEAKGLLRVSKYVTDRQGSIQDRNYQEYYTIALTSVKDDDTTNYADIPELVALYDVDGNRLTSGSDFDSVMNSGSYDEDNHTYTFTISNGYCAEFEGAGDYTAKEILGEGQKPVRTTYVVKDVSGNLEYQDIQTQKPFKVIYGGQGSETLLAYYNMLAKFYGKLQIGKTVIDQNGVNMDAYYTDSYKFTVTAYMNEEVSTNSTELNLVGLYNSDGTKIKDTATFEKSIVVSGNTTTFNLNNGQYVIFTCEGIYDVAENLTTNNAVIKTSYIRTKGAEEETGESDIKNDNLTVATNKFTVNTENETIVEYTNTVKSIKFNIKYYDRKIQQGKPSDINSEPSTAISYVAGKDITSNISFSYYALATYAVNKVDSLIPDNILDSYVMYSESDVYRNNQYGKEVTGEKWLQWKSDSTVVEDVNDNNFDTITDATVWLKNSARKYDVSFYLLPSTITNASETSLNTVKLTDGTVRYVPKVIAVTEEDVYFNQLIGSLETYNKLGESETIDQHITNYLDKYGKDGYTGEDYSSAKTITYNYEDENGDEKSKTLYFAYWSFDPNGSTIASTDYEFHYRVTGDMSVYAIYSEEVSQERGLTVVANDLDIFVKDGVDGVRLNTLVSVYNFKDNEGNDIIENLAGIYVIPENDVTITSDNVVALQNWILSELNARNGDDGIADNYQGSVKIEQSDIDTYEDLKGLKGANFLIYRDTTDTPLSFSNKNRVNMILEFTKETLKNRRMLAFAAINYTYNDQGDTFWRISDNCIDYTFDENGDSKSVTSIYESKVE